VIGHLLVAAVETGPMQQQILMELEVIGPLLVFEKLLAHEQHRHAGRGQADAGRDARAAAAEPRARVGRVAQPCHTFFAVPIDDVVVLGSLHETP
jgi:hypothetical protein